MNTYNRHFARLLRFGSATFLALLTIPAWSADRAVTSTNDSGPGSLRQAIATASPGDSISFSVSGTITLTTGALLLDKNLTINGPGKTDLAISGNNLDRIFFVNPGVSATISGLTIRNGRVTILCCQAGRGGAIVNHGLLTLSDSIVEQSFSADSGGGIGNMGTMLISNTTISGNSAGRGGGIMNFGSLTISTSTLSNNSTNDIGGAIYNRGTVLLTNSTISGNNASWGGAAYNHEGSMTLVHSTVASNTATANSGGIYNQASLSMKNSIIASNTSIGSCLGGISYGHNLADSDICSGFFNAPGDQITSYVGLDPSGLQNNGGPTPTIGVLTGSPAADSVPGSACAQLNGTTRVSFDQRGVPRPQGNACDVGAYETQSWQLNPVIHYGVTAYLDPVVFTDHPVPAPVPSVASVSTGKGHTLGLTADGRVLAWGRNIFGQLGDGTTVGRTASAEVPELDDVIAVSAGGEHSLALKSNGTVWAWGRNVFGQLGDGTTVEHHTPVQVAGLADVRAIAAGGGHSLALKNDGTVWAWGWDNNGQLGIGGAPGGFSVFPVRIATLSGVTAIAAGALHTLATTTSGRVYAWGYNSSGQIGDGSTSNRFTPTLIAGVPSAIAVAAGTYHSLALTENGSVWAWGANDRGQLGIADASGSPVPAQVPGVTSIAEISAGHLSSGLRRTDGTVYAAGLQYISDSALATAQADVYFRQVLNISDAVQIELGESTTVVLGTFTGVADTTSPNIECTPPDVNSWYTDNVEVSCTASEDAGGSGLAHAEDASFILATSISDDTETSVAATGSHGVCDLGGNCATAGPYTFKVDRKAPVAACSTPDASLWYASDVQVVCSLTDDGSGPASSSVTLITNIAGGESATASTDTTQACDQIGNCTTINPYSFKVDAKSPTIDINRPLERYSVNQVVTADFQCHDGFLSSCTGTVSTGSQFSTVSAGTHHFSVEAIDLAGNRNTKTVDYKVGYGICSLYDPTKVHKSGSTVPLKIRLCDAAGNNLSSAATVVTATGIRKIDNTVQGAVEDSGNANPDSNFRYDAALGGYIFNLKTTGYSTGTYVVQLAAAGDPTTHATEVKFDIK